MEKKTTHEAEAIARLVPQYRNKARLEALLRVYARMIQGLEDAAWELLAAWDIDAQEGAQLDRIGAVVGQAREGRDDPTYRIWIRGRIALNRASGTVPELVDLVRRLSPAGATSAIRPQFPAGLIAEIMGAAGLTAPIAQQLARVLQLGRAAGVSLDVVWSTASEAGTFAFSGGAGAGFGSTADPAVGGVWASVIAT